MSKLNGLIFGINTAVCSPTQVSLYYALNGRNNRLPLDVMFPLPHAQDDWTMHIMGLHQNYQTISRDLSRLECSEIVFNNEYYFSPRGKIGLSRKLTCHWSGPYSIIQTFSSSLSVIFPAGSWMQKPKEITALNSRLRKIHNRMNNNALLVLGTNELDTDMEIETGLLDINDVPHHSPAG